MELKNICCYCFRLEFLQKKGKVAVKLQSTVWRNCKNQMIFPFPFITRNDCRHLTFFLTKFKLFERAGGQITRRKWNLKILQSAVILRFRLEFLQKNEGKVDVKLQSTVWKIAKAYKQE